MWSFIKGLLLIKDRPIAKEMVDADQQQSSRHQKPHQPAYLKRRMRRKNRTSRANKTQVRVKVYDAFLQFLNFKK